MQVWKVAELSTSDPRTVCQHCIVWSLILSHCCTHCSCASWTGWCPGKRKSSKNFSSSFSGTHFRSQNEILQNCIDGSSGILQRKKINFLHVGLFIRQTCTNTRFFGSAPTKSATSAMAESYRGRTVDRNHLDIRDARWCFYNSIYIHCMASLICENFYTLCFIVFFSSLCQTLKHYSLLSPNL